jgi:glycerate-2-kinase
VSLIFSDIPGDDFGMIASGPTYKDETTINDAQKIINKYQLGTFNLNETPKDDKFFEKVHNIPLLSNQTALDAMKQKAQELGFQPKIVSAEIYNDAEETIKLLAGLAQPNSALIAGGEISVIMTANDGSGGRNLHLALNALKSIKADQLFIAFASDGLDNGPAAGAIVDAETINRAQELKLDIDDYLKRFDSYPVFEKLNAIVFTGPTNANISDLMLLLEK